jgi:hypothetical protein
LQVLPIQLFVIHPSPIVDAGACPCQPMFPTAGGQPAKDWCSYQTSGACKGLINWNLDFSASPLVEVTLCKTNRPALNQLLIMTYE